MDVKNLSDTPVDVIIDCFQLAFEKYYVPMPPNKDYYVQRWKAAKVDFALSFGMFDQKDLVGFIIHGIDTRNGYLTAFNTGTGVLPSHRGKRIVKKMYKHVIPALVNGGIQKSSLEVITLNERAIKAYKGVGFEVCKNYKCYGGEIELSAEHEIDLRAKDLSQVDWKNLPNQNLYSWDFQKESLQADQQAYYEVYHHGVFESYFILNLSKKYLSQFDLMVNDEEAWARLFQGIKQVSQTVKVINVDDTQTSKIKALNTFGLINNIDQYEMELFL